MKLYISLILIFIISCSSNEEAILLENLSNALHEESEGKFATIRRINNNEYQIKPSLYKKVNFLDSVYNLTRSAVEGRKQNEIQQLFDEFVLASTSLISGSHGVTYIPNTIPSNNASLFAKVELAMLTNDIVETLAADIGMEDVKFDELRAFVEHGNTSIKLGESFSGKVYLTAVSSAPNRKVYFLMNEDTLKTNQYNSEFNFQPKTRGKHKLTFSVESTMNS